LFIYLKNRPLSLKTFCNLNLFFYVLQNYQKNAFLRLTNCQFSFFCNCLSFIVIVRGIVGLINCLISFCCWKNIKLIRNWHDNGTCKKIERQNVIIFLVELILIKIKVILKIKLRKGENQKKCKPGKLFWYCCLLKPCYVYLKVMVFKVSLGFDFAWFW